MSVTTRLVTLDDVPELAELGRRNREFLAPWTPLSPDESFTDAGVRASVVDVLVRHDDGSVLPHVIIDADGAIVGRINLNSIIRGALQGGSLGYWVARDRNGRGIATAAVALMVSTAFAELRLHRVQAETLPQNVASQAVLERNGFERIGFAPAYLSIAGSWQDHVLHQRVNDAYVG